MYVAYIPSEDAVVIVRRPSLGLLNIKKSSAARHNVISLKVEVTTVMMLLHKTGNCIKMCIINAMRPHMSYLLQHSLEQIEVN